MLTCRPRQPAIGVSKRDRVDALRRVPAIPRRAVVVLAGLDGSAEADHVGHLRPLELPRVAGGQPVLGQLELPAVAQHLSEDAVVVANAVPVRRDSERGHALHEARREPAEAAVAQRGVRFECAQAVEIDFEAAQRRARGFGDPEVAERVEQQAPDQELEREVVDPLAAVAIGAARGVDPAVDDVVARHERGRHQPVVIARVAGILADHVGELVEHRLPERDDAVRGLDPGGGGRVRRSFGAESSAGSFEMFIFMDTQVYNGRPRFREANAPRLRTRAPGTAVRG